MHHRRTLNTLGVGAIVVTAVAVPLFAAASTASISHAYHTASTITNGSLVALDRSKADYVVPANADNGSRLIGVAVNQDGSLLAIDSTKTTIQVATTGSVDALASTANGDIAVGDEVSVSPFNGIGMKVAKGHRLIGLAQSTLNAKTGSTSTREVTNTKGKQEKIEIGYIRVTIAIGPPSSDLGQDSNNPIQRLADKIAGHTVSTIRVVISGFITVIGVIALITLVYSAVYGSVISIGRNPLAKIAVFRTLGSILAMAAVTAVVVIAAVYFLLR